MAVLKSMRCNYQDDGETQFEIQQLHISAALINQKVSKAIHEFCLEQDQSSKCRCNFYDV